MMKELLAHVRTQSLMSQNGTASTRAGTVSSYDPGTYSVRVLLQPEHVETNWLPLLSPWIGNGWGMFAPPSLGDMVDVGYTDDDPDAGYAALRYYSDIARPLAVESGEFWLVHKTGSFLKLTNDGRVLINGQVEIDVTAPTLSVIITGDATMSVGGNLSATVSGNAGLEVGGAMTTSADSWNHTGPVNVNGTITASEDVIGGGIHLKTHTHSGVLGGPSNTGVPNP